MSLRAFAARLGTSHVAIGRAIRSGKIARGVVDGKVVDPALAEEDWRQNLDRSRAPGYVRERAEQAPVFECAEMTRDPSRGGRPPKGASTGSAPGGRPPEAPGGNEGPSLAEATAAKNHWQAELARLKYQREAGELVPAAEVRGKLEKVFRACVTKLLAVPSRAKQALPGLSPSDLAELERLQREALEELASGANG